MNGICRILEYFDHITWNLRDIWLFLDFCLFDLWSIRLHWYLLNRCLKHGHWSLHHHGIHPWLELCLSHHGISCYWPLSLLNLLRNLLSIYLLSWLIPKGIQISLLFPLLHESWRKKVCLLHLVLHHLLFLHFLVHHLFIHHLIELLLHHIHVLLLHLWVLHHNVAFCSLLCLCWSINHWVHHIGKCILAKLAFLTRWCTCTARHYFVEHCLFLWIINDFDIN